MKKKISAAIAAAIMILAAAGCSGGTPATTTAAGTTAATTANQQTQVAFEANIEDTTDKALEYLERNVPLFRKYLDKRRSVPMSLETTFNTAEGTWTSNIYIKDELNAVLSSVDPSGTETRTIYSKDRGIQLDTVNKKAYVQEFKEERLKDIISSLILKLRLSDVMNTKYTTGTGTIEGVEYNCESIAVPDTDESTVYYFSKDNDDLVYIKDGDTLTKILRLENVFDKDDLLTVPADYEEHSYKELSAQLEAAEAKSGSAAQ